MKCDENENYFLQDGGKCKKCAIEGCLNCKNEELCLQCDHEAKYFSANGLCSKFSIESDVEDS